MAETKVYNFEGEQEAGKYWILEKDYSKNPEGTFFRRCGNAYTIHMRGKNILLDRSIAKKIKEDAVILKVEEYISTSNCYIIKKAEIVDAVYPRTINSCPSSERERTYGIKGSSEIVLAEDKYGLKYIIRKYRMMRLGESCEPLKGTDYGHIFFDSYVFDGKNYKAIETPPYRISHEKDPKDYSTWYYKSSGIYDNILVDISVS